MDCLKKLFTRNIKRFPPDFMFQLTKEEWDALRFQNGIINIGRGTHTKYLPHAYPTRH
ncbi:MAG: ORF6N domain-containing protein [Bacteroidaceae bacterium]|nr:ORF6N domain-containing protein [Bacteroidaceae bacterium]